MVIDWWCDSCQDHSDRDHYDKDGTHLPDDVLYPTEPKLLVLLVDHEHAFVGSRHVSHDLVFNQPPSALRDYLQREFPNMYQDNVLVIRDSTIIEEKIGKS